jgi:GNAT superfamily N-acetyltransferase
MSQRVSSVSIRQAESGDREAALALADRLPAFGPATRTPQEIATRERRALADAFDNHPVGSSLVVADHPTRGVVGVLLLESRRDYFTDQSHGHVAILAVAREAEGQGVGRALLAAAEEWGRQQGFRRLTLAVFADNVRAKEFYLRQGWRVELETHFKTLDVTRSSARQLPPDRLLY